MRSTGTTKTKKQHAAECKAYCENATNCQLENIYRDEKTRAARGGEVGKVAKIFANAAKTELISRNLWPV